MLLMSPLVPFDSIATNGGASVFTCSVVFVASGFSRTMRMSDFIRTIAAIARANAPK